MLVTATHDEDVANRHAKVLELNEGRVVGERMTFASLAVANLVRMPGRTFVRVLVLAAAVALVGAMILFVGNSLTTMTSSATASVPLDWQGPVASREPRKARRATWRDGKGCWTPSRRQRRHSRVRPT